MGTPRITLCTDFGTRDGFVGVMKGILASKSPGSVLHDITHDIPPGDVQKGARVLGRVWRAFPEGTVHLVVVDPGVGTSRRGLALAAEGHLFVAPDNGTLTPLFRSSSDWRCVELRNAPPLPPSAGHTFHGRDLFAPAAGLLAEGVALKELGPPVEDPTLLDMAPSQLPPGTGEGEVVETDRFGNLATNLDPSDVARAGEIWMGSVRIPFRRTYGEVDPGELVAVLNSDGLVEVAVRDGSAKETLSAEDGARVRVFVQA